jgi:16S rRNA (cytosine967-C5)-methyltransferase
VNLLGPQPGEQILDLCAAPGGKLTFMAQLMRNEGTLIAHDFSPARLKWVEENCARLGVTCAKTVLPAGLDALPQKQFDRVLVDAPCSNTGVMRRRVDLRWRIRDKEIERLRREQLALLRQAAARLKPGGTLVYSTCSLEPEENRGVVDEFLKDGVELETERELIPFENGVDGAYAAKFKMRG